MKLSPIYSAIAGPDVRPLMMSAEDCAEFRQLRRLGIDLPVQFVREAMRDMRITGAVDDTLGTLTTPSISTPIQFLQAWLPGLVRVITAARRIDEMLGIMTAGAWEDEEVVQTVLEPTGDAIPYGDYTNVPLASWNANYERRTVVRFEQGIMVGTLQAARSARVRINDAAEKRNASMLSLEIIRNRVGFYGYNDGDGRTYGVLNDPSAPAYVPAASNGGSPASTQWKDKTFQQITADIRGMFARLQTVSKDTIDVQRTPTTFVVATSAFQYLTVTTDLGTITVMEWIRQNYPKCRVMSAPEFDAANGGENVAYLYADKIDDGSTDGGAVWAQVVPAKFQALGTEKRAKGYLEDFSNATAGVMLKRPYALQRLTGI